MFVLILLDFSPFYISAYIQH